MLQLRESSVRKVISEVEAISPRYFISIAVFPGGSKRGRPVSAYNLNQEAIVTFPETAFLLIELASFPTPAPYRVDRGEFETYLVGRGMASIVVKDRIDVNIRVGYIREHAGFPGYISPTERIQYEWDYLEKLARRYELSGRQGEDDLTGRV